MSWIEKIQNKSNSEKVKIIGVITITTFILLIILWIIVGSVRGSGQKDVRFFNAFGSSFNNFSKAIKSNNK